MLLPAVPLDASMPVADALARLARHGLWLDPAEAAAHAWIARRAEQLHLTPDAAAALLRRDPAAHGVAIRRQCLASILWYAERADDVLARCVAAAGHVPLIEALALKETDSVPAEESPDVSWRSVIVRDGALAGVNLPESGRAAASTGGDRRDGKAAFGRSRAGTARSRGADADARIASTSGLEVFPSIQAPGAVTAHQRFDVRVGLGVTAQKGVAGGPLRLEVPEGARAIALTVELISDGFDAPDGWTRPLAVAVADPAAQTATFTLIARAPAEPEGLLLTTLDVRYIRDGTVCGTASKPIVVTHGAAAGGLSVSWLGTPWLQPASGSAVALIADPSPVDLTIELSKPDRNPANGRYVCRLRSPHPLSVAAGPFDVDLGDDAKTFAATIVEQVRQLGAGELSDLLFRSIGGLVSDRLPLETFDALREVAARVAPARPSVLFVSAEPFVPWELALVDPPLDAAAPPFLGAQAVVGRWLREDARSARARPAPHPPSRIPVKHMAVMAGKYKPAESGLRELPAAEAEARALVRAHHAIPLAASPTALRQLLEAALEHNAERVGAAGAVHFAGHGDFNPAQPDASVLYLSDGKALSSLLFRAAKYGGDQQPFLFLNACMIGIGGEVLGDMGGFPGNSLRGGFGAVLGALWAVEDDVAYSIAHEFWARALPAGGALSEPVGEILRDLRQRYQGNVADPIPTYLAYAYYGHPRLQLQRAL
jgi:hypothetical protein